MDIIANNTPSVKPEQQENAAPGELDPSALTDDQLLDLLLKTENRSDFYSAEARFLLARLKRQDEQRYQKVKANAERCGFPIQMFDSYVSKIEEKPTAILIHLSDVEPEEPSWLWEPYIALGKITLLEGDPGLGKTWSMLQITAAISKGGVLPDQNGEPTRRVSKGKVIYISAEDGVADTLAPRLKAADANLDNVLVMSGLREGDIERGFTLEDMPVLEREVRKHSPLLIVLDPLQAFLGSKVDMNRANQVRPFMAALGKLAETHGCAVVCIRHPSKGQSPKAIYRGLGSIDFTAAARSVLYLEKAPTGDGKVILAQSKNSLAKSGVSLVFELREGKFYWCGTSILSADDLAGSGYGPQPTALQQAMDWLTEVLQDGSQMQATIQNMAEDEGISIATLKRAKKRLSVISNKDGNTWYWKLPNQSEAATVEEGDDGVNKERELESLDLLDSLDSLESLETLPKMLILPPLSTPKK